MLSVETPDLRARVSNIVILLDPRIARELGTIAANSLDEAISV
jgi:hypothetical protein